MKNKILLVLVLLFSPFNMTQDKFNPQAIQLNNKASEIMKEGTSSEKEKKEKYNKVLQLLDEAIKIDSSYYIAYSNKMNVLIQQKEFSESIVVSKLQLSHKPDLAEGFFFLGLQYENQGDSIRANESYKKAVQLYEERISQGKMVEANEINLAVAYRFIGEEEKANILFKKYLSDEKHGWTVKLLYQSTKKRYLEDLFNNN